MATSKLQRQVGDMLDKEFPEYAVRENFRPDWLVSSDGGMMELDFYIEGLFVAFEIQGSQHFSFIPFFHKNREQFEKSKKRDAEKIDLCYGKGIKLYEICTMTDAIVIVKRIKETINPKPKYFYSEEYTRKEIKKIERNPDGNRKARKDIYQASDNRAAERLADVSRKLEMYEVGMIYADEQKVSYWKRVIENNGYEVE